MGRYGSYPYSYRENAPPVPEPDRYAPPEAGPTRNFAWSPSWMLGGTTEPSQGPYQVPIPSFLQKFVDWHMRKLPARFEWHPKMQERHAEMEDLRSLLGDRRGFVAPMPTFRDLARGRSEFMPPNIMPDPRIPRPPRPW